MNYGCRNQKLFSLISATLVVILTVLVLEGFFALLNKTQLRYSGTIWHLTRGLPERGPKRLVRGWASGHASRVSEVRYQSAPFQIPLNLPVQLSNRPFYTYESGLLEAKKGVYDVRAISPDNGRDVYRARYTIGGNGYRVTPGQDGLRKKYAVFLGDSFIFGIGVNDNETIPYYFSKCLPEYRVYNFGFGGYGPNDLLARARRENNLLIPENGGVVIYAYYSHHAARAIGGLQYLGTYGRYHPFFVETKEGEVVQNGKFQDGMPFRVWLSSLLLKTQTVQFFRYDWPLQMNTGQARLVAKMIDGIRREYLRRLPGAQFLFVMAPGAARDRAVLLPMIDELGIESLDYSDLDLDRYVEGGSRIQLDGHYRPEANRVFADQLARDVEVNLKNKH